MIVIDIKEDADTSHYEVLEIAPSDLEGLKDEDITSKVRIAAKNAKRPYNKAAQKGDKEAEEQLDRINQAENQLKFADKRKKYNEEMENGKGAALEVLRAQPIAPSFFRNRNARFKAIEYFLRTAGLNSSLPMESQE